MKSCVDVRVAGYDAFHAITIYAASPVEDRMAVPSCSSPDLLIDFVHAVLHSLLCIHSCSTQRLPGLASTGMDMRLTRTWTSADPMVMLVSVYSLNLRSSWPDSSAQQGMCTAKTWRLFVRCCDGAACVNVFCSTPFVAACAHVRHISVVSLLLMAVCQCRSCLLDTLSPLVV